MEAVRNIYQVRYDKNQWIGFDITGGTVLFSSVVKKLVKDHVIYRAEGNKPSIVLITDYSGALLEEITFD